MIFQARFGAAQTGLGYQFYDATGDLLGTRSSDGITGLPEAGGYIVSATPPAGAAGIFWDSAAAEASEAISAEVAGLSVETVAALAAAEQILLVSPYVPDDAPALILPVAADDANDGVMFLDTQQWNNVILAGVRFVVTPLGSGPFRTEAGRVIDLAPREYFTDVLGRLTITAERSDLLTPATLRYRIRADAYAIDLTTPLEVAILNLNTLL
jgi:hypothetical protein